MPRYLAIMEEFFSRAGGFVVGALLLSLGAAGLLLAGRIDPAAWQTVTIGVWGSVVGGGAISAFRPK